MKVSHHTHHVSESLVLSASEAFVIRDGQRLSWQVSAEGRGQRINQGLTEAGLARPRDKAPVHGCCHRCFQEIIRSHPLSTDRTKCPASLKRTLSLILEGFNKQKWLVIPLG